MYLIVNKCVTAVKVSNFSGHYLRNRSTLDIGVLGYIGIVQHKEHISRSFVHSSWDSLYIVQFPWYKDTYDLMMAKDNKGRNM